MSAREEILNRLRDRRRKSTLPPVWKSQREFPDLAARFTDPLTAVKGEVRRAENLEQAWDALDTILREVGAQVVVANDHHEGNTGALQCSDLRGEFALVGGRRITVLVKVAGEEDEIHGFFDRHRAQEAETSDEVPDSRVEAGGGVYATVSLYSQVEVGKMEDAHLVCR